ncbi:MAG: 6-carboxytetrahydropterin synthase [Candidatus Rokubacteria bacterium]|nr:6-carboxytetrahydropterin synthase [Candidatus Rokubacteria bacterium]
MSVTTPARSHRVALTRAYHFSAAHRLSTPALGPEENARLYGPCHRPHGHNYYVEVTVTGPPDPQTGMAFDLRVLDAAVERAVVGEVDHRALEDVPLLAGVITTGEGLARAFFHTLEAELPHGTLAGVVVQETAKNRFEYRSGA